MFADSLKAKPKIKFNLGDADEEETTEPSPDESDDGADHGSLGTMAAKAIKSGDGEAIFEAIRAICDAE